jgi:hypothetical protein
MNDEGALKLVKDVKTLLVNGLREAGEAQLPNNPDNRLLVTQKAKFILRERKFLNNFDIICDESNNPTDVNDIMITFVIEFKEHMGRHYAFTLKLESYNEPI